MAETNIVEETVKRLSMHEGVEGVMVLTGEGIVIRSTLDSTVSTHYAGWVSLTILLLDHRDEWQITRHRVTASATCLGVAILHQRSSNVDCITLATPEKMLQLLSKSRYSHLSAPVNADILSDSQSQVYSCQA